MLESLARPEKSQSIHLSVNNLLFSHLLDAPKPRASKTLLCAHLGIAKGDEDN
jgi:hypothetical protein